MHKSLTASLIFGLTQLGAGAAGASDFSLSAEIGGVSEYVFRGTSLAAAAIQPGLELSNGNVTIGVWSSSGFGKNSELASDEIDLYAAYGFELVETASLDIGLTYYHYPQGGDLFATDGGAVGSYEPFASLSFDTAFSPTFSAYYDLTLEALTLEAGLTREIMLTPKAGVEFGFTASHIDADGSSYAYGQFMASAIYEIGSNARLHIDGSLIKSSENTLNYSDILAGRPKDQMALFGAGITANF